MMTFSTGLSLLVVFAQQTTCGAPRLSYERVIGDHSPLLTNDTQFARPDDGLGPAARAEFLEQPGHVSLDRVGRDLQLARNFLVGTSRGEQLQHFELASTDIE